VLCGVCVICALPATRTGGPAHAMKVPLEKTMARECLCHVERQRHPWDGPSQPSSQFRDDATRPCHFRGCLPSSLPGTDRNASRLMFRRYFGRPLFARLHYHAQSGPDTASLQSEQIDGWYAGQNQSSLVQHGVVGPDHPHGGSPLWTDQDRPGSATTMMAEIQTGTAYNSWLSITDAGNLLFHWTGPPMLGILLDRAVAERAAFVATAWAAKVRGLSRLTPRYLISFCNGIRWSLIIS
jgi:hypothetical protein